MGKEAIISKIISDAEAIRTIADDIAERVDIEDQHRLHAIRTMAKDIIDKAKSAY